MPHCGATTGENHVAQTVLFAVCGFLSPHWPQAADLPEKQRSALHGPFPEEQRNDSSRLQPRGH